ncbi:OmpA/MotB domain protein [Xylanimonas cellulosilytica DSM 15894]|uniref:OmpA/MotB domain protein n=2 Tax=Xylanimonas TaxID=186188 RepID=D1BXD3_XYLCX|nr:OmpA/MotB domain protein [Xylanimonas cellulosilytica DSM 15894]
MLCAVVGAGPASAQSTTPASASSAPTPSPDPELMQKAEAALAEQAERIEAAEITDALRADATFDLAPEDATFALATEDATFTLRPDDSTITVETRQETEDDTVVTLTSDLLFGFGESALTPEAQAAVAELATTIPQDAAVRVDGHTDAVGSDELNLTLSEQRADAVAAVLSGARPDLVLTVEGHGEADPVASNEEGGVDNPAGRALNRRVEVTYPTP